MVFEGAKRSRYYFVRTVGDSRAVCLKELAQRIAEGLYKDTDLIAANAIIGSQGKNKYDETTQRAGDAASAFLNARRFKHDEGYETYKCEEV